MSVAEIAELEKRTYRVADLRLERRGAGDGKILRGHAAVFDSASEDLGGFVEYVRKGCFAHAIRERQDVRGLIDHDSRLVLGRTAAGTLRLQEDAEGLAVEIDMPDTTYAQDLCVSMKRGDITQMSFGFRTVKDSWREVEGETVRDLLDVDLFDVSVVTYPAYPDTAAAVRALRAWQGGAGALSHPLQDPAIARMLADIRRP